MEQRVTWSHTIKDLLWVSRLEKWVYKFRKNLKSAAQPTFFHHVSKMGILLRHSRETPFFFAADLSHLRPNTPSPIDVLYSWIHHTRTSEQLRLGPAEGAGSSPEARKRREVLELYSTTIKQLQGPQLRSYMLLLSFALRTLGTLFLLPHVRTHSPLSMFSHTSVLPQQNERCGSSWNRTSQWDESKQEPSWRQRAIIQHINRE